MMTPSIINTPPETVIPGTSSLWSRVSKWASENKTVVYAVIGVSIVVTGTGAYFYWSPNLPVKSSSPKKTSKSKKKLKTDGEGVTKKDTSKSRTSDTPAPIDPDLYTDNFILALPTKADRLSHALKLKTQGNKCYGSKDYNQAIKLYTAALKLDQDPIFYCNRAACHHSLAAWDDVIADTTAALSINPEYTKALNRRANAYKEVGRPSDALIDYTASCIMDRFSNADIHENVERLLKVVAEQKAKTIMSKREKKLPTAAFVRNFIRSFREKPLPAGLASPDVPNDSGKCHLKVAVEKLYSNGASVYRESSEACEKALEVGDLGPYEALAYNLRATFRWLMGDADDAFADISKAIALDPTYCQNYIIRASMLLESRNQSAAEQDYEEALRINLKDPDLYYHRAQYRFVNAQYDEAARDYQQSINLDPEFMYSYIQLGVTQYKKGSVASSTATFEKILQKYHDAPDAYNYYGELLLDRKLYKEAVEHFDRAMELEKEQHPTGVNVLPLVNKALAVYQWRSDINEAQKLCEKALLLDEDCDIAVATLAQLLLQNAQIPEALKYFERAAELSRTEGEIVNAIQYAEATRTQLEVQQRYPQLQKVMQEMSAKAMASV